MKTEFGFIGWCKDDAANHDKIWGYFYRPTREFEPQWYESDKRIGTHVVVFWARRGKAMQFKAGVHDHALNTLVSSKLKKGYEKISEKVFLHVWPDFIQACEEKLMWDVLAGKVK